jgi:hypothetical protein
MVWLARRVVETQRHASGRLMAMIVRRRTRFKLNTHCGREGRINPPYELSTAVVAIAQLLRRCESAGGLPHCGQSTGANRSANVTALASRDAASEDEINV